MQSIESHSTTAWLFQCPALKLSAFLLQITIRLILKTQHQTLYASTCSEKINQFIHEILEKKTEKWFLSTGGHAATPTYDLLTLKLNQFI